MTSPKACANRLSAILNATHGSDRFPLDVKKLAYQFSRELYPTDPIVHIAPVRLPGFEGSLVPRSVGVGGWNILYNDGIRSDGRINYTLAHEFGHYMIHRENTRPTFLCSVDDITGKNINSIEREANDFAATFLMPLDDFRSQINEMAKPSATDISNSAQHYGVSWTAACLRWLEYTRLPSLLVVSRDDFILWARSSKLALQQGAFYRTRSETHAMPVQSLAVTKKFARNHQPIQHGPAVWFNREAVEYCIESDYYDFSLSLLHLGDL